MDRFAPGQLVQGRYRIVGPLGKGGMGHVHLAEDLRVGGKLRAVKVTRPLPEERDAFIEEARLLSGLQHPHLPQITDYFPPDENGEACIVMDYIAGDTLAERFRRYGGRLPFAAVVRYLTQLCGVLSYLHAQRPPIVFRDLKPANVLIDAQDRAVLVDFGVARRFREGAAADTLQLGTPGFAAPEQLRGAQSDARTDLYGLGALAYYLLSGGRLAFGPFAPPESALQDDVPPGFARLLSRLLAESPRDRPPSAAEVYRELRAWAGETDGDGPAAGGPERPEGEPAAAVVAFVSAYPGAGATFAALMASASLRRRGRPHALVECPGGEPELYGLLDGGRRMPSRAVFADPSGCGEIRPAWRDGAAAYYPLAPEGPAPHEPDEAFAAWLRRLGTPLVLLDVSSRWERSEDVRRLLARVSRVLLVADCFPAKWSFGRQAAAQSLAERLERANVPAAWIANRDQPFSGRAEWLSLFPRKPAVLLPQLPVAAQLERLWSGGGARPGGEAEARAQRALEAELARWEAIRSARAPRNL